MWKKTVNDYAIIVGKPISVMLLISLGLAQTDNNNAEGDSGANQHFYELQDVNKYVINLTTSTVCAFCRKYLNPQGVTEVHT